jgi:hypothetical protein
VTHDFPRAARGCADDLSDALRRELVRHWTRREQHERQVGDAFGLLADALAGWAAPPVVSLLSSAANEEQRHAEHCHRLSELYAGTAVTPPARLGAALSEFGTGDERLELSLNVVGLCCVNETIATAWLRHCLELASVPELSVSIRAHLADEIDHARAGWAHLASSAVSEPERAAIGALLPDVIRVNVAEWKRAENFLSGAALPSHGLPTAADSLAVIERAVRELVEPGFRYVGLPL